MISGVLVPYSLGSMSTKEQEPVTVPAAPKNESLAIIIAPPQSDARLAGLWVQARADPANERD